MIGALNEGEWTFLSVMLRLRIAMKHDALFPTPMLYFVSALRLPETSNPSKLKPTAPFSLCKREKIHFSSKKYSILLLDCVVFFTFALIKLQRIDKMTTQRYFYSYFFYFTYRVKREVVR